MIPHVVLILLRIPLLTLKIGIPIDDDLALPALRLLVGGVGGSVRHGRDIRQVTIIRRVDIDPATVTQYPVAAMMVREPAGTLRMAETLCMAGPVAIASYASAIVAAMATTAANTDMAAATDMATDMAAATDMATDMAADTDVTAAATTVTAPTTVTTTAATGIGSTGRKRGKGDRGRGCESKDESARHCCSPRNRFGYPLVGGAWRRVQAGGAFFKSMPRKTAMATRERDTLQSDAGYVAAKPLTARSRSSPATHGRTILSCHEPDQHLARPMDVSVGSNLGRRDGAGQ